MTTLSLSAIKEQLEKIAEVKFDEGDILKVISGFIYDGFNPEAMWNKILTTPGFSSGEMAIIIIACMQKGYGYNKFLKKVKSNDAKNIVEVIIKKYSIAEKGTESDTPTLQRIVSTAGYGAFICYIRIKDEKKINVAVDPSEVGLKAPLLLCMPFMYSIMGPITGSSIWEPIAIVCEYLQAKITMKTMDEKTKVAAGIVDTQSAMLRNRTFANAARGTPVSIAPNRRAEVAQHLSDVDYRFFKSGSAAVSQLVRDDLCTIYQDIMNTSTRLSYIPLGKIGAAMKDSATFEDFKAKLDTNSLFAIQN
jgi:hypothetical protein